MKVDALPSGASRGNALHKYISASAPVHLLEASRYLGRAMQALLLQEFGIAKHLAYYAEMRATMGLLATEGIGVFNNCHVVLTGPQIVEKIPQKVNTHVFIWEAFDVWSKQPASAVLLSSIISAWNLTLGTFFSACYSTASLHPLIQSVLAGWGVDLKSYQEDRRSRNEASYRPSFAPLQSTASIVAPMDFVQEFWTMFEPSATQPFEFVDRPLFSSCYRAVRSQVPAQGSLLTRLQASGISNAPSIARYVQAAEARLPLVYRLAKVVNSSDASEGAMAMISRAGLLIRIGIGSCAKLFLEAGLQISDLDWWFQSVADRGGISAAPFTDSLELWDDVRDALDDCATLGVPANQHQLLVVNGALVATLQQCERLSVWGFSR